MVPWGMLLLFFRVALAGACSPTDLNFALTEAGNSYLKGDHAGLSKALRATRRALRCVELTPELAFRFHVARALEFGSSGAWANAEEALRSAVAAHPSMELEAGLAGDPRLRLAFYRAQETGVEWTSIRPATFNGRVHGLAPDTERLQPGQPSARRWALGLGATAAVLYGGAWVARSKYETVRGGDRRKVVSAHRATNGLTVASGVLGLGAATALVVSFR